MAAKEQKGGVMSHFDEAEPNMIYKNLKTDWSVFELEMKTKQNRWMENTMCPGLV